MDKKFFIILFATIFYNGVTHSSPIDAQKVSDVRLPEEKPPTVQSPIVDHINKKIEPVAATKPSVLASQNSTEPVHTELPVVKNETIHTFPENGTAAHQIVDSENGTQEAANKTNTEVVDNKNQTTNSAHGTDSKNVVQPEVNNGTAHVNPPAGKTDVSTTVPADQNTKASSTTSATAQTTVTSTTMKPSTVNSTTMKPSTVTPTVSTMAPTSRTKDNVISGQNTPAPAQEKHFDGASFVGGIVLTIGLTAIGFIAFKYYKSGKIDMSYRTL